MDENTEMIFISRKDLKVMLEEIIGTSSPPVEPEYETEEHAMKRLGIKSKSHLWRLRTEGKIAFSQPSKKIILYKISSLKQYLDSHLHKTF